MQAPSLSPKKAFEQCKCCLPEGLGILGEFHPLGGWTGKKKNNSLGLGGSWNDQKWGFLATWVGQGQNGVRNWQAWAQTGGNWSGNYCASANLLFNKMKCLCSITNTNNRLVFFFRNSMGYSDFWTFSFSFPGQCSQFWVSLVSLNASHLFPWTIMKSLFSLGNRTRFSKWSIFPQHTKAGSQTEISF